MVVCAHLSAEDREKMEGYLAWKWGLVANLPSAHPYKSNPPRLMPQAWDPSNLSSGLRAWFDANDGGTITASAGKVSSWADKSGNGYSAAQATGAVQPTTGSRQIGGRNAIDFVSQRLDIATGPFMRNQSAGMVISVIDPDSGVGENAIVDIDINSQGSGRCKSQIDSEQWSCAGRRLDGDSYDEKSFATPSYSNAPHIFASIFDWSNAEVNVAVDGTKGTAQAFQTAGSTSDTDSAGVGIGARDQQQDENYDGAIAEIVIVEGDVSDATREKIEGYLAWKWGLQDSLPAGHPYKSERPFV